MCVRQPQKKRFNIKGYFRSIEFHSSCSFMCRIGTCSEPLGVGWNFTLPDSAFNASSSLFSGQYRESDDFSGDFVNHDAFEQGTEFPVLWSALYPLCCLCCTHTFKRALALLGLAWVNKNKVKKVWSHYPVSVSLSLLIVSIPGPWDFGAHNGRLYKQDDRIKKRIGGWCAKHKNNEQWLQVDLGKIKFVTAVATQGKIVSFATVFWDVTQRSLFD